MNTVFGIRIRTFIIWITFVAGLTCCYFIFQYFHFFHGNFSAHSSDWGNFGQYIGGLVTPIITFLNFIVITILYRQIVFSDQQRWITDIRITSYREIIPRVQIPTTYNVSDIERVLNYLSSTTISDFLFMDDFQQITDLGQLQTNLSNSLTALRLSSAQPLYNNYLHDRNEIVTYITDFLRGRNTRLVAQA